jgi:isoamylase
MLQAGDELGRTQRGNNNAYCQDNDLSWLDWDGADEALQAFVRSVLALRREQPLLRADRFRHDTPDGDGQRLRWLAAEGGTLVAHDWQDPLRDCLGCLLTQEDGHNHPAHSLLIVFNAGGGPVDFLLPAGPAWRLCVDTARAPWILDGPPPDAPLTVAEQSLVLLVADSAVPDLETASSTEAAD